MSDLQVSRTRVITWGDPTATIQTGKTSHEICLDIHPDEVASIIIATLEGAIMLSNLYKDPKHIERAATHISSYIENIRFFND